MLTVVVAFCLPTTATRLLGIAPGRNALPRPRRALGVPPILAGAAAVRFGAEAVPAWQAG